MNLSKYEITLLRKYEEALSIARMDFIEAHEIWLSVALSEPNKKTAYARWLKWQRRNIIAEERMTRLHLEYLKAFRKLFDFKKSLNVNRDELIEKGLVNNA